MLPHITCLKQSLYMGNRQVDKLTNSQSDFLLNCNGTRTFSQVLQQNSTDVSNIIHLSRYLLWWPYPVNNTINTFEKCDRLILCASPEVPWLGMGGRILNDASERKTTILTCFNACEKTRNPLYKSGSEYILACRDESAFASRLAGVSHVNWNISLNKIKGQDSTSIQDDSKTNLGFFNEMIHTFISTFEPSEIFIPGSMGQNNGSDLVQNAVITLVAEGYIQGTVHIYEDVSSSLGYRHIDEFYSKFEDSYLFPFEHYVDTSGASSRKTAMLDLFRCGVTNSQKSMWLSSDVRNAKMSGDSNWTHAERFWKLDFSQFI